MFFVYAKYKSFGRKFSPDFEIDVTKMFVKTLNHFWKLRTSFPAQNLSLIGNRHAIKSSKCISLGEIYYARISTSIRTECWCHKFDVQKKTLSHTHTHIQLHQYYLIQSLITSFSLHLFQSIFRYNQFTNYTNYSESVFEQSM